MVSNAVFILFTLISLIKYDGLLQMHRVTQFEV